MHCSWRVVFNFQRVGLNNSATINNGIAQGNGDMEIIDELTILVKAAQQPPGRFVVNFFRIFKGEFQ